MFSLKHLFHSPKADGTDSTLVKPTNWNDEHALLASQSGVVVGRVSPGAGQMEEIPLSGLLAPAFIMPYAGAVAPAGWLLCNGASVLRSDWPGLFAVIGGSYGAVDGAHFRCPTCVAVSLPVSMPVLAGWALTSTRSWALLAVRSMRVQASMLDSGVAAVTAQAVTRVDHSRYMSLAVRRSRTVGMVSSVVARRLAPTAIPSIGPSTPTARLLPLPSPASVQVAQPLMLPIFSR